jgi:hypothetical protein
LQLSFIEFKVNVAADDCASVKYNVTVTGWHPGNTAFHIIIKKEKVTAGIWIFGGLSRCDAAAGNA